MAFAVPGLASLTLKAGERLFLTKAPSVKPSNDTTGGVLSIVNEPERLLALPALSTATTRKVWRPSAVTVVPRAKANPSRVTVTSARFWSVAV